VQQPVNTVAAPPGQRISLPMEIEQLPPHKPNFLLILILFGVAILVIFVVAYFFVDFDGKHLTFRHHSAHPTSHLIVPAPPGLSHPTTIHLA
jgi:hypothetical protein